MDPVYHFWKWSKSGFQKRHFCRFLTFFYNSCPAPLLSYYSMSPKIPHFQLAITQSFPLPDPKYPIFLETLDEIQFNGGDPKDYDHHQECQDDQECPPSTGRFLMTISPPRPYVSYIFRNLGRNPVQWRWPQASWSKLYFLKV